jgi:tRNA(adenine34) deaminase
MFDDNYFMRLALREADKAMEADEIPVGVVIVADNQVIARAYNLTEKLNDVTAHAEMQAITSAADRIGGKFLNQCTMYVTLEPCVMCAGAIYWARFDRLVFGAYDQERGFSSFQSNTGKSLLHPKTKVTGGVMQSECAALLAEFFKSKR